MLDAFVHTPRIAYFTMEIALRNDIPTYAGGLGVLAGDTMRSAADLELPMVGVSLVSRAGYFRQRLDTDGRQTEEPAPWEPAQHATPLEAKIALTIGRRAVWVRGWLYVVDGRSHGKQPVILLDTDLPENHPDDRLLTHHLYGGDDAYRIKQEIVLGIGGLRLLRALGFAIRHHHLNEGHSALLALELLRRHARTPEFVLPGESPYDIPRVRALCNFTTHTPLDAGHDRFDYGLVEQVLDEFVDRPTLRRLAGDEHLNMTRLALNLSEYVNGVAKRHAEISVQMFPGHHVHAISNGVHPFTWTAPALRRLYDRYVPGWDHDAVLLTRAEHVLPDGEVWEAHAQARRALIETVRNRAGVSLRPGIPILGFARRMTAYKRPDLLFTDTERLRAIARRQPFQVVIAGKAHPRDAGGKRLIETIHGHMRALAADIPIAYLADYDLDLGLALTAGVDVWLNTPLPPFEASGTSGMKAAFNGVPHLSVLDGWWREACIDGVNGWSIGAPDVDQRADGAAAALYEKLEQAVLPLYGDGERRAWIALMKGAIAKSASVFGSHRMMRRYASEAYLR